MKLMNWNDSSLGISCQASKEQGSEWEPFNLESQIEPITIPKANTVTHG